MNDWKDIGNIGARIMARSQGSIGFDVQNQVDESFLPVYDPKFIEGIIDYSKSAESLVHNKESVFNEFANDSLYEKREQLERMLYDGTLAVEGGIGMGFEAYTGKKAIYNPYNKLKTKFEEFLIKYDLSE